MTTIESIGPQLDRAAAGTDPRGWLVFAWLPSDLQRLEDQRAFADYDEHRPRGFDREATPTERLLLTHLGYVLPDELLTVVRYRSAAAATDDGPPSRIRRFQHHDRTQ